MTTDQSKPTARRQCSTCASELGFTEGDPCDNCVTAKPTALLPCPLCPDGGKPYFTKSVNGSRMLYVGCSQCGLELKAMLVMLTPVDEQPTKDIIALWNTRAHSPAQAEWLPIESAPKDGGDVLLWVKDGDPVLELAYWGEFDLDWVTDTGKLKGIPSHWMRPQPPKEDKQ